MESNRLPSINGSLFDYLTRCAQEGAQRKTIDGLWFKFFVGIFYAKAQGRKG